MLSFELPILPSAEKSERKDAAENRQLILATASRLFAENGVENVCMSEIAKAAGVGKGTLYRRFCGKGELCLALLDTELQRFQNTVLRTFRQQTAEGLTGHQQLNWFIDHAVQFTDSHLSLMVEISEAGSENTVQDVNQPHFWMEMTVQALLHHMKEQGEISADLDLDYVTSALLSPLDARIMKAHRINRGFSTTQISHGLQSLIDSLCH